MSVASRFDGFLANLRLTDKQLEDGASKRAQVCKALNQQYWNSNSETDNSQYVGSWMKLTRIRPPRDVDVLFKLPADVYQRFEQRQGNKQSQLLQELRGYLIQRFSGTDVRGDGPVIVVPFVSYAVELLPAFGLTNGRYWIPFTTNGGRYIETDPDAEKSRVSESSRATNDNTRSLVRMMKCWQGECNVPIKSFWLELIAIDFLASWGHAGKSSVYYDWMVRDFLNYLVGKANTYVYAPGTYDAMFVGDAWKSRAESAHSRAKKACQFESDNFPAHALEEWRKIFGHYIS